MPTVVSAGPTSGVAVSLGPEGDGFAALAMTGFAAARQAFGDHLTRAAIGCILTGYWAGRAKGGDRGS